MLPTPIPRLTSCISPTSKDKAMGAPEVSEGHRGNAALLEWGKGLCSTEMILWSKEGWQQWQSCSDAGDTQA